jgi:hypothetical protein
MKKRYLLVIIPFCLLFFGCKKKKESTTNKNTTTKITTKATTKNTTRQSTTSTNYDELLKDYYYKLDGDDVIIFGVKNQDAIELVVPEGVTKIIDYDDDDYDALRYLENL